jgi:hypothetical protein
VAKTSLEFTSSVAVPDLKYYFLKGITPWIQQDCEVDLFNFQRSTVYRTQRTFA